MPRTLQHASHPESLSIDPTTIGCSCKHTSIRCFIPTTPLVKLARRIDWDSFNRAYGPRYCDQQGAPAKATRRMVGLHYLKHTFNESDESVVARGVENPYWQYFCGFTHLQHECPIHPTRMTRGRQRLGPEARSQRLPQTLVTAVQQKHLPARELEQVNIDSTVQKKNITHPTDSKRLHRAVVKRVKAARQRGLGWRQSYVRVSRRAAVMAGRDAQAQPFKRMRRELRRRRSYGGRLIRDRQPPPPESSPPPQVSPVPVMIRRWRNGWRLVNGSVRRNRRKQTNLTVCTSPPETIRCIRKGKVHKCYMMGRKAAVATTDFRWAATGSWPRLGVRGNNPDDGHTLAQTLQQVESIPGVHLRAAYLDKGWRGHDYRGPAVIHMAGSKARQLTPTQRPRRRRGSAIEPKMGLAQAEDRLGRCDLKGMMGDAFHAVLAAARANLRKLLRL